MIGKLADKNQREFFRTRLEDLINPKHELALLANAIDWQYFEDEFKPYYSDKGAPSVPIRMMVGCLMSKHLYNLGDERVPEHWESNVYSQYFCGSVFFEHKFPFSFRFLANYQVNSGVSNLITLNSYIGTLITLSLLMGLFFELPVMSWLLSTLGIINTAILKKYRRHAIVIILTISAIITPTTDIFTLLLVSLPIIFLYELSIIIVRFTQKKRKIYLSNETEQGLNV